MKKFTIQTKNEKNEWEVYMKNLPIQELRGALGVLWRGLGGGGQVFRVIRHSLMVGTMNCSLINPSAKKEDIVYTGDTFGTVVQEKEYINIMKERQYDY